MPDYGNFFWPLDDASGPTAVETLHGKNGAYGSPQIQFVDETGYHWFTPTDKINYRVEAPSASGFGVEFLAYANGRPYYDSPTSSSYMSAQMNSDGTSAGAFYQRQAFTVSFKIKWYGPGATYIFTNGYVTCGFTSYTGQDPFGIYFSRSGSLLRTAPDFDFPADTEYNNWDNWEGIYKEPYKTPQWAQVVLRYDGARKSIWIDGVNIATDTSDDTFNVPVSQFGPSVIMLNNQMFYLKGYNHSAYAELAIYHHALSDAEIGG